MFEQGEILVIPDNLINTTGCLILLMLILIVVIATFLICIELNKQHVKELSEMRKEIELERRNKRRRGN